MLEENTIQGTKVTYTNDEIKRLPPSELKEFCRSIIAEILENNPNGLSATKVAEISGFDPKTVRKHLEYLVAIRESYKMEYGDRTTVYFPNGTLAHAMSHKVYRIGDKYYTFKLIKNSFGEFLFIQEKKKDEYNRYRTLGGLVVQKESLGQFIKRLKIISEDLNESEDDDTYFEVTT